MEHQKILPYFMNKEHLNCQSPCTESTGLVFATESRLVTEVTL